MKTRENIRRSIYAIDKSYQIYKNIIPWKYHRAKPESIREYCTDNKEQGHSDNTHFGKLVKFFPACKEEIKTSDSHISKPEQIWNNKEFHKRNIAVKWRRNQRVATGNILFQPVKPWEINKCI